MKTCFSVMTIGLALLLMGCGETAERPALEPVSGKVTVKGKAVEGALVSFWAEGAARAASGTTDAEGKFQLTTFDTGDGAVLGEHTVTISKQDASANMKTASADDPSAGYGAAMDAAAKGKTSALGKHALPAKYANQGTSGLKRTVAKGSPNTFDFDLK
ncbi:MAG: hypothetical protein O3A00_23995 [Planctomycetota bacterium]|nr:hypothetical protein [Planctomycetota bacterium]